MPRLGLGLGVQVSAYSAYDADAASYFVRAGVTDTTAKRQISDFVEGLKSLGLYNSIVCYPLRSSQNKGSGTIAYSLGGLGTYDGTLNGSILPTWGASGISFLTVDNNYIDIPTFTASPSSYLIGAVFNPSTTGLGGSCIVANNGTTNADAFQINDSVSNQLAGGHRQVAGSTYISPSNQTFTTGVFQFAQQGWTGSVVRRVLNKSSEQTTNSAAFGGFISPLRINSRGDSVVAGQNKIVSFAYMLHSQGASLATANSIYDLYNSTLGADLYDLDAETYFTNAGITDTTAKRQISDFVVGAKELGLWNSMVCWPLRSSQNSSSGATIYSLGGLGTFNGTLLGSPIPTRASDFMVFSDTSKYMEINGLTGLTSTMFLMTVTKLGLQDNGTLGIDVNSNALFGGQPTNYMQAYTAIPNTIIGSGLRTTSGGGYSAWNNLATGVAEDDLGVLFIGHDGTNQLFRWNNTTGSRVIATTVGIGTRARLNVRSDDGTLGGKSDYAFTMMCNGGVSDANFQSLRTLYKDTLGVGLGLP